jgi:hypothetical protein
LRKREFQGSLEYIIIIGGVIILAAASYFMLRGFSTTTAGETTKTVEGTGEVFSAEIENIVRTETQFEQKIWFKDTPNRFGMMIGNPTGSPLRANISINKTNLTDSGVNLSTLRIATPLSPEVKELSYAFNATHINFVTDLISASSNITIFLYFQSIGLPKDVSALDHISHAGTILEIDPTESNQYTDPPFVFPAGKAYSFLVGNKYSATIPIHIIGTAISDVKVTVESCAWTKADNLFYACPSENILIAAYPKDGSYGSDEERIHLQVRWDDDRGPEPTLRIGVNASDKYGNYWAETKYVKMSSASAPSSLLPIPLNYRKGEMIVMSLDQGVMWDSSNTLALSNNGNYNLGVVTDYNHLTGEAMVVWLEAVTLTSPTATFKYAYWDGTTWAEQGDIVDICTAHAVDALIAAPTYNLAVDYDGGAILVWQNGSCAGNADKTVYSRWDGSSWGPEGFVNESIACKQTALAFNSSGDGFLACYSSLTSHEIRYLLWNGTGWNASIVLSDQFIMADIPLPDVAIHPSGDPIFVTWTTHSNCAQVTCPDHPGDSNYRIVNFVYSMWSGGSIWDGAGSWSGPYNLTEQ